MKYIISISKLFFKENSDTYVEIDDNLVILKDNSIVRTSEITGYKQLYKLDLNGNQKAITTGNWDVIDLYGVDNNLDYLIGFINETCVIKYNNYKIWYKNINDMYKPFIEIEEKNIPIFNWLIF